MLHGTGGREYIIGWIDAQILAEGLPAVVSFLYLCFVFVDLLYNCVLYFMAMKDILRCYFLFNFITLVI